MVNQKTLDKAPLTTRKLPNPKLVRLFRLSMVVVGCLIIVIGLLLFLIPKFKVKTIQIVGSTQFSVDKIAAASGIAIGDELYGIDRNKVENRLLALSYYEDVKVDLIFPTTVKITVVEKGNGTLLQTSVSGTNVVFDDSFTVLSVGDVEGVVKDFPVVTLPQLKSCTLGKPLVFADSVDTAYMTATLSALRERNLLDSVTALDFSSSTSVSFILEGEHRVVLGDLSQLSAKLDLAEKILSEKAENAEKSVLDVSDTLRPTYRILSVA